MNAYVEVPCPLPYFYFKQDLSLILKLTVLPTLASQQAQDLCHCTRNLQGAGDTQAASTLPAEPFPDSPFLLFLLSDTISFSSAIDFRHLNKLELSPDRPRTTANNLAKAPSGSCLNC